MTKKQEKSLKLLEYFIQPGWKVTSSDNLNEFWMGDCEESEDGISPEEAFFLKTDKGIKSPKVSNTKRLWQLLWGHRWMTAHEKMWREGCEEGTLFPADFWDEPEYIKDMFRKIWESFERVWYEKS